MIKQDARELHRWATANAGNYAFLSKEEMVERPDLYDQFCREVNQLLDDPKVLGSELEEDIMEINNLSCRAKIDRNMDACTDLAVAMRRAFIKRHGSRKEKQELESAGSIIGRIFPANDEPDDVA